MQNNTLDYDRQFLVKLSEIYQDVEAALQKTPVV